MRRSTFIDVCLLVSLICICSGCSGLKRSATEADTQLAVIIEGSHKQAAEERLENILSKLILTPQPEQSFYTTFAPDDSLYKLSRWPNVLLVGTLDSDDPVSLRLQRSIKGEALEGVKAGQYNIFQKRDVWAKGQTAIFVVAADQPSLISWLNEQGEEIFELFSADRNERMKKQLYSFKEQKDLSEDLQFKHGWKLRIQHDYSLVSTNQSPDYVRLRRNLPDRLITIAWRHGEAEEVSLSELIAWRNQIGAITSDSMKINLDWFQQTESEISGRTALKMNGLWESYGSLGGGPFVSYMLYADGTLYLLDGMVFAPDRPKETFIRQLDTILNTFQPPGM